MIYVKSTDNLAWISILADNSTIPAGFIEITEEEYYATLYGRLDVLKVDDDNVAEEEE